MEQLRPHVDIALLDYDSPEGVAIRVAAGAALLDEERPGWHIRVYPARLQMSSPCRCVIGQEFGVLDSEDGSAHDEYAHAVWSLGLGDVRDEPENLTLEYGFCAVTDEWAQLEHAWKVEIRKRREAENACV